MHAPAAIRTEPDAVPVWVTTKPSMTPDAAIPVVPEDAYRYASACMSMISELPPSRY